MLSQSPATLDSQQDSNALAKTNSQNFTTLALSQSPATLDSQQDSNALAKTNSQNFITLALSQSPATLDPRRASDAMGMRLGNLIFQSLVRIDSNLNIQPDLALRWEIHQNQYTFLIPKNIQFSNQRYLQKEDIEFSFKEYTSPRNPFYSSFKIIQNVQVQNDAKNFKLTFSLKNPSATFLSTDLSLLKILPRKEILENESLFQKKWIGTGPFEFISQNDHQIHLRNKKTSQNIFFKIIRDDLTRYQKLLKKEIDIVQNELPYLKVDKLLKKNLPYDLVQKEGLSVNYLIFNLKDSLFKNKQARKTVALGLNIPPIIRYKFKNYVTPATSILPSQSIFFNSDLAPLVHQAQKAKDIINKNNWKQKKITLTSSNNREVISYVRVIAQQLRDIGFQVQVKSYEWGTFYGDLNKGNFQIAFLRWTGVLDPDIYRIAFHSSERPPRGRNRSFYVNPVLDELLEKGRQESQLQKRIELYKEVQQIIQSDLPIIPLWHNQQISFVKKNIQGYFLPFNGSYDFLQFLKKEKALH